MKSQITISLEYELAKWVEGQAIKDGKTKSAWVMEVLEAERERRKRKAS